MNLIELEDIPVIVVAVIGYLVGFLLGSWTGLLFFIGGLLIGSIVSNLLFERNN